MNVTAFMKNFLDRFAYTLHRPRSFNQYTMIVSTTGALGLKETIDRLSIIQFAGYNTVHTAGFVTLPRPISEKSRNKISKRIAEAAEKFYHMIEARRPPSPKLNGGPCHESDRSASRKSGKKKYAKRAERGHANIDGSIVIVWKAGACRAQSTPMCFKLAKFNREYNSF